VRRGRRRRGGAGAARDLSGCWLLGCWLFLFWLSPSVLGTGVRLGLRINMAFGEGVHDNSFNLYRVHDVCVRSGLGFLPLPFLQSKLNGF
jgi:hypothetical protein